MKFENAKSIEAGVAKSPEHREAEKELVELRVRETSLNDDISKCRQELDSTALLYTQRHAETLARLHLELTQCRHRSAELRRVVDKHRPIYARQVRAAIASQRREAAVRVAKALADYRVAATDLKVTDQILTSVHANPKKMSEILFVENIIRSVYGVIAECDGDLK